MKERNVLTNPLQAFQELSAKAGLPTSSPVLSKDMNVNANDDGSLLSTNPKQKESEAMQSQSIDNNLRLPGSIRSSPVTSALREPARVRQRSASPAIRGSASRIASPARARSPSPPLRVHDVLALVPLRLFPSTHSNYCQSFVHERKFLEDFLSTVPHHIDEGKRERAKALYRSLCDFTLHQDLIGDEPFTQPSLRATRLAQWSVSISSKFRFLEKLLSTFKENRQRRLALFVKPGRTLTYVEEILSGLDVSHSLPNSESDRALDSQDNNQPHIYLISTDQSEKISIQGPVDLIVGLDESFSLSSPAVQKLRQLSPDELKPPTLGLVVPFSLEHFVHDCPGSIDDIAHLQDLLHRACQQRERAGKIPTHFPSPEATGFHLAEAMEDPSKSLHLPSMDAFPLPPKDASRIAASALSSNRLSTDMDSRQPSTHEVPSTNQAIMEPGVTTTSKRPAEYEPSSPTLPKRPRVTPQSPSHDVPTSSTFELTRITGSTGKPPTHKKSSSAPLAPSTTSHQSTTESAEVINDLRAQLRRAQHTEASLQSIIQTHERTIAIYQPQHQELLKEKRQLSDELQQQSGLRIAVAKLTEANTTMRETLQTTAAELEQTKALLSGASNPDVRELAELRTKAAETDNLKKSLEASKSENTYIRELYQDASTKGAAAAAELEDSRETMAKLKEERDAAMNLEKLQLGQHFSSNNMKKASSELKKLRGMLENKERLLGTVSREKEKLKEDNEALRERVGVGLHTRASSVRASSVPGGVQSAGPAGSSASAFGKNTERPRPSESYLRAAAAGVVKTTGGNAGSRSASRAGSRQGSRAASPGPGQRKGAGAPARGSTLRQ